MSCGFSQPLHAVQIVDPQHLSVLGDSQVGEIWAAGPAMGGKGLINGVSAYILDGPSRLLDGRGCRAFRGTADD